MVDLNSVCNVSKKIGRKYPSAAAQQDTSFWENKRFEIGHKHTQFSLVGLPLHMVTALYVYFGDTMNSLCFHGKCIPIFQFLKV